MQYALFQQLKRDIKRTLHPTRFGCSESPNELHSWCRNWFSYVSNNELTDGSTLHLSYWAKVCVNCEELKPHLLTGEPDYRGVEIRRFPHHISQPRSPLEKEVARTGT